VSRWPHRSRLGLTTGASIPTGYCAGG
jgi:hypothetical protein